MRIISGTYKGRRIHPPHNIKARPTTDIAKEGLFNILSNRIDFERCEVLDLFSGTGNIGFEFASRNVKMVTSVDSTLISYKFINKYIVALAIGNMNIHRSDAFRFIRNCRFTYDIIFADPPYQLENVINLPDLVFNNKLLNKNGLLIVEHSIHTDFSKHDCFFEKRNFGKVNFSFFNT